MLLELQDEGYKATIDGPFYNQYWNGAFQFRIEGDALRGMGSWDCFEQVKPYLTHLLSYMKENGFISELYVRDHKSDKFSLDFYYHGNF